MIRAIFNLISGLCFTALGISECSVVGLYPSTQRDVNDLVMCFLYTIGIVNLIMGGASIYISYLQWKDQSEHYTITTSTGISIWGLILYFRYPFTMMYPVYRQLLLAEMIFFFTRLIVAVILVCGSCLKREEV
jgi:hypothetical protein